VLGILYFRDSGSPANGTDAPALATVSRPEAAPSASAAKLVWFTYIPKDKDLRKVAQNFDFYILIQGNEAERDLMIDYGAKGPFIQYLEFESIQDPGSCTDEPQINQVTSFVGDFCRLSEEHPDWFLLDADGERIRLQDDDHTWYLMDPGNEAWRAFYLERIRSFQKDDENWAGVFLDNVPLTLAFREDAGQVPALYPTDAAYQAAIQGFLQYLHENYFKPRNKLLIGNLSSRKDDSDWVRHLKNLDGAMLEGWAIDVPDRFRPVARWEEHLHLAEETQAMGKIILLVSRGEKDDYALQEFAYASFLLIQQGNAYFRYAGGDSYNSVWLYDNYNYDLGEPLGMRYRDGDAWRRDFTRGSVTVNPQTHEVEITLSDG
jgi:hypothetical protein